jgi:hypothetical protein
MAAATMNNGRSQRGTHLAFGSCRILTIRGIEHCNHRNSAGAIEPCPLALNERLLNGFPIGCIGGDGG